MNRVQISAGATDFLVEQAQELHQQDQGLGLLPEWQVLDHILAKAP